MSISGMNEFNELTDLLEKHSRDIDSLFQKFRLKVLQNSAGLEETCGTCTTAGCCYQSVSIPLFDAFPIARRLRREGKSTVEFRALLRKEGEEMESMDIGAWFDKKRPCLFLTDDKKCSVYEHRPRACANHFVVSPPANCSPPTNPDVTIGYIPQQPVTQESFRLEAALQTSLGISLDQPMGGSLPKMVAVVLEALTKPWDEFSSYIEEHSKMTEEMTNTVTPERYRRTYESDKEYKEKSTAE